jgi:hypothetical protein
MILLTQSVILSLSKDQFCCFFQHNSNGVDIVQPRVGARRLPWVSFGMISTLKGLKQIGFRGVCGSTLSGLVFLLFTQGRRWCANPGLNDSNPYRIAEALLTNLISKL